MRILLVSTPRSGNMWTRRLLRSLFDLEERSVHDAADLDWEALPDRVVVQLHADRTPELEALLERHGFRVVVLARHPLDVLISILHFARHEPQTANWLGGAHGDESKILDATPTSRAFLRYATSHRAKALLGITPQWWDRADVRLRYEDLLADTRHELELIAEALDERPAKPYDDVLAEVNFGSLQSEAQNVHFWRGNAGGWQELLTIPIARKLVDAHADVLVKLGYLSFPDEPTARERWSKLLIQPR
ncbi:MAG TPA: sulfotransferase domain-containing protein [Gaiellaceae bacterium]|nr:sulfotransferase domain-containing protein [Gaiellaceae bacterium]